MAITKKIRFEVFKRDGFRCQYCGNTPPKVTLEIDHVNPKSKGGENDINNLVTSCFDCNRGKSDIPLEKIPNTLATNLEILEEKELQLKEYNKMVAKIERRIQGDMQKVDKIYSDYFDEWCLSEKFKNGSLRRFLQLLPVSEVEDAMRIACEKIHYDSNRAIRYFCGICWNKIKGTER